ncbi:MULTISPECIES: hypothetical protein [unclassified Rhizobium]|jgi:hypothetical protein|uniref:hypothetical protein n=1 Tax=Rhizobium/Agrobacterium group TaxID=227290 RepID=UPI0008A80581|nr:MULTISPECIES: hypothetical protein [unclassified Rhizobium]MBD8665119.1 hypothetical protein [Rhizobium sp. CFBP 8752]SEH29001.1 hypothetical protein SAMN03159407_3718 [Rhizobium sp. NFR12]
MDQTRRFDDLDGGEAAGTARLNLEARMTVLEIVSITSLAMALDTSENANVDHAKGIASLILDTVHHRCRELGMTDEGSQSAHRYADELLSTALLSLYPNG